MSSVRLVIPACPKITTLRVLAWTDHFFGPRYLDSKVIENPNGPDITLEFTRDRNHAPDVDAIWFHAPSITDLPRQKNQPWILMSMESAVNYPALTNAYARHVFDLWMTYQLDADVPCLYPNWRDYGTFLEPPPERTGPARGALAVYVASHPVPARDAYVRELMRWIPVDSLGACLHNASIPGFASAGVERSERGWPALLSVLPRYKFYLAFENSQTVDYVTERIFHALACGVVPVYLGAPNVREFLPDDDAVIVASDFASPRALADYLRYLDTNDHSYQRHLHWKRAGYSSRFAQLVDLGSIEPQLRMAVKLAHGCQRRCRCGGRMR